MGLCLFLIRKIKHMLITVSALFVLFLILSTKYGNHVNRSVTTSLPLENISLIPQSIGLEHYDWNNYSMMERDFKRTGLGEQGTKVPINVTSEESVRRQKLMDKYNYDAYYADRISLERSIGDMRPEACKRVKYIKDIPENSVSIIIPMFNEKNSTLLRTIHSIINRSPAILLKEVIVVDDCSQEDELKAPLDDYVREHFSKVKIIRNKQREGLIRSRMIGADASTGSFLVFLDSHIEVNYNYLPPLLEIIVQNYRTIACPTIDSIGPNFKIYPLEKRARGAFDWKFGYRRMPVTVPMDDVSPHESPIMMGCAFAISRRWWEELDKYDPGMDVWGAEHLEISIKSWLCGGRVVDSPCARVAHLFKAFIYGKSGAAAYCKNIVRFATVWMDGFAEVVFQIMPQLRKINPGLDILKRVELRKQLKCKPFDWFFTEVAPDILEFFPISEPLHLAWGHVINKYNSSLCIILKNEFLYLSDCSSEQTGIFMYDWRYHILETHGKCFNAISNGQLKMDKYSPIELKDQQAFAWDPESGRIVNSHSHLCVDVHEESYQLFMSECVKDKLSQSWTFQSFNASRVTEAWEKYTHSLQ